MDDTRTMDSGYRRVTAEVIDLPRANSADLARLRSIAYVMDNLFVIPGTGWRVGLDGVIGLIPGIGDIASTLVSFYFVFVAARMGVSKIILSRMCVNVLLDAAIGAVPFFGDIFDFGWKANQRNLSLLENTSRNPRAARRQSAVFLIGLAAGLIALAAGAVSLIVLVVRAIWRVVTGA